MYSFTKTSWHRGRIALCSSSSRPRSFAAIDVVIFYSCGRLRAALLALIYEETEAIQVILVTFWDTLTYSFGADSGHPFSVIR